ncbi:hypothetical protein RRG08_050001 [Elysia crispata]|uniref:GTP cyclohydrolase 1 feedback regulatory protein n=1 Tax=Elysia crispata TaxID=231223 RepID=A0AAE1EC58_9GAST|nr:hypothetical protein RRG08_050001 [Elysia crispata]
MPYVIISIQVRLDVGPTFVGDEWSDPELMESLNASLIKQLGNNYAQYKTDLPPRQVLDRLETKGFKLVAMTGVGQTCIWTMHKEAGVCALLSSIAMPVCSWFRSLNFENVELGSL